MKSFMSNAAVLLIPHPGTGEDAETQNPGRTPRPRRARGISERSGCAGAPWCCRGAFLERPGRRFAEHDGEVLVVDAHGARVYFHKPGEVHLPGAARDLSEALENCLRISFSMLSRTS